MFLLGRKRVGVQNPVFAFLVRVLEILVIIWLIRFLLRSLFGGWFRKRENLGSRGRSPFGSYPRPDGPPPVITGEIKRDPQCGTFVSTELSLKSRFRNEELHFCSRQCQEEFLRAHSDPAA